MDYDNGAEILHATSLLCRASSRELPVVHKPQKNVILIWCKLRLCDCHAYMNLQTYISHIYESHHESLILSVILCDISMYLSATLIDVLTRHSSANASYGN